LVAHNCRMLGLASKDGAEILIGGERMLDHYVNGVLTHYEDQLVGKAVKACYWWSEKAKYVIGDNEGNLKTFDPEAKVWEILTPPVTFEEITHIIARKEFIVVVGLVAGAIKVFTYNGVDWIDRTGMLGMPSILCVATDGEYILFGGGDGVLKATTDFTEVKEYTDKLGWVGINVRTIEPIPFTF